MMAQAITRSTDDTYWSIWTKFDYSLKLGCYLPALYGTDHNSTTDNYRSIRTKPHYSTYNTSYLPVDK